MDNKMIDTYVKYFNKINNLKGGSSVPSFSLTTNLTNPVNNNFVNNRSITITDGNRYFQIDRSKINNLRLKLNLSPYGNSWRDISTYLDAYYSGLNRSTTLYVNTPQWDYLNGLKNDINNIYSYPVSSYPTTKYYNNITFTDGMSTLFIDGNKISEMIIKLNMSIYGIRWPDLVIILKNATLGLNSSITKISTDKLNVLRNIYLRDIFNDSTQIYKNVNSYDLSSPDIWNDHPNLVGAKVIFSDGIDNMTVRGEDIHKLYKKIKNSSFSKKYKKIKRELTKVSKYSSTPIYVTTRKLDNLLMLKQNSLEYIKDKYPKNEKKDEDSKKEEDDDDDDDDDENDEDEKKEDKKKEDKKKEDEKKEDKKKEDDEDKKKEDKKER